MHLGNPVSLVTGTKTQVETDLELDGAPLGFRRLYSSAASDANIGLGRGWRHSFEWVPGKTGIALYGGGHAQLSPGINQRTGTHHATWAHDDAGRVVSSEHADGVERVTLDFGPSVPDGEIGTTTVTNSAGAASAYSYMRHLPSGASLLLAADGPGCATCPSTGRRYAYDEAGRLVPTTLVDDAGAVIAVHRREHDVSGRLLRLTEVRTALDGTPVERLVERREYVGDNARPSIVARPSVDPGAEHVTETVRDGGGRTVAILERGRAPTFGAASEPTGFEAIERTLRLEHDADGRLVAIDGPRTDVDDRTRLEWDAANRLVAVRPPASPALRITRFDGAGRPAELRIGGHMPVTLERDAAGDVTAVRRGEIVVRYEHDAEGRLVAIVDPDGRRVTIEHDAAGRVASITDDLGRVEAFVHDGESRVVARSRLGMDGATLRSFEYRFDAGGRLSASVERGLAADGSVKVPAKLQRDDDPTGLARRLLNPDSGAEAIAEIDLLARLTTFTAPDGATTVMAYDAAGRDVALIDARGNTTRYPADDFGRVVLFDSPDTSRVRHALDAAGNRVRTTLATGAVVLTRFDAANRAVESTGPDGTTTWRYGTDADGGAHGRLVEGTNPTATERFGYDAQGRLATHVRLMDGHAFETRHAYDARGRLGEKRLPDGQELAYHYHEAGPDRSTLRAIVRGRWWGLADETVVGEIDLDARDGRAGWTSGTGVRTEQRFAPTGELVGLTVGQALGLDYEFDAAGRIVGIDERGRGAAGGDEFRAHRYGYARERLVSASGPSGQRSYAWDAVGNRTASALRTTDGTTTATSHAYPPEGAGNRLLETTDAATGLATRYRYDAAGAPLESGNLTWRYDARRRPVEVRRGGEMLATYAYNAFGERVKKAVHSGPGSRPTITYFLG